MSRLQTGPHRQVTRAVHEHGARICLQILHAGRYGYHPLQVAPSRIKAPINPFTPRALSANGIERQIRAFARTAMLARDAGYDGVEVMGSEGYLLNQFTAPRTNKRQDGYGGDATRRMRFAVEIVERIREACGPDFILIYRLSMLDLVEDGLAWDEVVQQARAVEQAGATLINTGIGWHEARIPTIATSVPRAAFTGITARLRPHVRLPLVATNRINMPEVAERVLAQGEADIISMARPLLADPRWVAKARASRPQAINTCIACNQACLDHVFQNRRASCLVNPRACAETELVYSPTQAPKSIAVVGAGPAGLACATVAAARGHRVTLFESAAEIGGQFNLARRIPGKEEFAETLRYFGHRLDTLGVDVRLGTTADAAMLAGFDHVVVATGVAPRALSLPGADDPRVASYLDVLTGRIVPGRRVAIIGAGGIGFDVAEFLVDPAGAAGPDAAEHWRREWGVDLSYTDGRGGLVEPCPTPPARDVWLLQRTAGKPGARLGKTTGWIHRSTLKSKGVQMLGGVEYVRFDDEGLHLRIADEAHVIAVDHVVVCAGQEPHRPLATALADREHVHVIGGASVAAELDAKRAIDEGSRLAATF